MSENLWHWWTVSPIPTSLRLYVSLHSPETKYHITAVVIPRVTCDLPLQPVHINSKWNHLSDLQLADPDFRLPGKIDILLGADVYADVLLHGRQAEPPGSPTSFETQLGWVPAGRTNSHASVNLSIASNLCSVVSGDDILRKFWKIEVLRTVRAILLNNV